MNYKIIKYIAALIFTVFLVTTISYSQQSNNIPSDISENLFIITKQSIINQLNTNKQKSFEHIEYSNDERGIFIRLINNKTERGCIGFVKGVSSFEHAAKITAIDAAFFDTRYRHITKDELKDIIIEITIIGKLEPIKDYNDFLLGKHTIYIIGSYGKAIMQAQIATERDWSKEEFLKAICKKAGIDELSYKNAGTKIYKADTIYKRRKFSEINIEK